MNKITCIAIDDEPLALGLVESYIKKTPFLELCGTFDNPIDAMEYLQNNSVQLMYLDIQMPDLTGIDFAKTIGPETQVIFTTAYDHYAVEGFKLRALDYLLKPISYQVFLAASNRAKEYFDLRQANESSDAGIVAEDNFLYVKADYKLQRVEFENILYFEGLKDYVKLYAIGSTKPIVFHSTMKAVEEKLPSSQFMRVHRSFIVSFSKVQLVERDRIIFGKERVPISKQYKSAFDAYIQKKFL